MKRIKDYWDRWVWLDGAGTWRASRPAYGGPRSKPKAAPRSWAHLGGEWVFFTCVPVSAVPLAAHNAWTRRRTVRRAGVS